MKKCQSDNWSSLKYQDNKLRELKSEVKIWESSVSKNIKVDVVQTQQCAIVKLSKDYHTHLCRMPQNIWYSTVNAITVLL